GRRAARKSTAYLDAYDLFLRGMWHYYQFNPEENRRAEECMRKAMALDPRLAYGHLGLARVLNGRELLDWSTDVDAEQRSALEAAQRAVELDDKDPYSHYVFCLASRDARMHQRALAEAQRAIDLNTNFALAYYGLGAVRVYVGPSAEAIDRLLRCMRLSPNEPIAFISYYFLGLAHYHQHDYEQAVQLAERGLALRRIHALYRLLAASLGQLGRLDQ